MNRLNRTVWVSLVVAACALLTPMLVSAHEHRDIAEGRYSMVVGFSSEPAFTGFLNGLDLRISDHSLASPAADGGKTEGVPVDGLEATLQAEVIFGDEKMTLPLEPRWQTPGAYDAALVPMVAGDYTFHIFGTIGDTAVDETFTSSPEGFSSVADQSEIQFPKLASANGAAPMFGSVNADDGIHGGAIAGVLTMLSAVATGAVFWQRRRRGQAQPAIATQVGKSA